MLVPELSSSFRTDFRFVEGSRSPQATHVLLLVPVSNPYVASSGPISSEPLTLFASAQVNLLLSSAERYGIITRAGAASDLLVTTGVGAAVPWPR